jgi:predicted transcriptional regulator
MSDEPIETAVERFLDETESALDDYDQGYADADATLSVIRSRMDELAAAVDEES